MTTVQLVAQDRSTPVATVTLKATPKAVIWQNRVFVYNSPGVYAEMPAESAWQ